MRIISGGIQHETNTFAEGMTTLADFIRDSHAGDQLAGHDTVIERYSDTGTIHGGYLAAAERVGFELVPVLNTRAYPSGMVARQTFDQLCELLTSRIAAELPADGILLDLHGAMVTEEYEDAEAEIVRRVRELVPDDIPIVVTLDLHANISPALAERATVIIGYDTYPHVDMRERGEEAAELISRIVRGEVQPQQAYRQLPLLTMPPMQCTLRQPMQDIVAQLHALEAEAGILTATIAMGFPFADIRDMGVTVLATADGDLQQAEEAVERLATILWQARDNLQPQLTTIERAIQLSQQQEGLVIFTDGSDNPGGGAPCDGTVALAALIKADCPSAVVGCLFDPETVQQAVEAGEGATIDVTLGGKTDDRHGQPLQLRAEVLRLSDGDFRFHGAMAQGLADTLGNTALLRIGGVEVLTASLRRQLIDRAMLETVDIDPTALQLLVLKSAVHFRADIGPLASLIVDGDTPGIHRPDFSCFEYHKLRRPVYPLDGDTERS